MIIEPSSLPLSNLDISMQEDQKKLVLRSNRVLKVVSDVQMLENLDVEWSESDLFDSSFISRGMI